MNKQARNLIKELLEAIEDTQIDTEWGCSPSWEKIDDCVYKIKDLLFPCELLVACRKTKCRFLMVKDDNTMGCSRRVSYGELIQDMKKCPLS